jgi:hypothetical protein
MATNEGKQELIDTLKFTPCTYALSLTGYGGEITLGTVDRKIYDYFEENGISLDEWNNDWDDELEVPYELQPFPPSCWYECDNLAHQSGVELSLSNYITVEDENNNEVWSHTLDPADLSEIGVEVEEVEEVYSSEQPAGTVVCYGQSVEKGLFFRGEIKLTSPFNPKKLKINYSDIDGWRLVSSVIYDGEELESWDYDTTGKSFEVDWMVIDEDGE